MSQIDETKRYATFQAVLNNLKERGGSSSDQGTLFERFCKKLLETAPFFKDDIVDVWMWKDFPGNDGCHDDGIDLVARNKQDEYIAIQCKFYDPDRSIKKQDIDSFISAATRDFIIDGKPHRYSEKLLFSTTDHVSPNVHDLLTMFSAEDMRECGIDWENFSLDNIDEMRAAQKKTPLKHQNEAIDAVIKGFKTNDRGRLVMACGTGKTFTSLKIVERLYQDARSNKPVGEPYNVLYLVPSIALLSQTIMEWKNQQAFGSTVRTFAICSDRTIRDDNKAKRNKREADELLINLPIPATTDVDRLVEAYRSNKSDVNIIFSTYQSIDVVSELIKRLDSRFDIAICDEAHRTIGSYKEDGDEEDNSFLIKIHDDRFVPCVKRLYMTATQKIYSSDAKRTANEGGYKVYSMDDEEVYGPMFHELSFGDAVTQNLLTDYRVVVLNIKKSNVRKLNLPQQTLSDLSKSNPNVDALSLSAKIIGSLAALSKIPSEDKPDEFSKDPEPMKRAVVFCSTIAEAKAVSGSYNQLKSDSCLGEEYMKEQGFVVPEADWITGQDNTSEKNRKLNWLRDDFEGGQCRILTNARCLSEGVDVPSLDGVVFIARKRSQVDIIQAVGRVMRKYGGGTKKRYGYIIIPVVIEDEKMTDETLSKNEDYKVVWQVVQALRSHDERLDTEINKVGVTGRLPENICVIDTFIPPVSRKNTIVGSLRSEASEGFDTDDPNVSDRFASFSVYRPSDEELKETEQFFSAQLVKHCGNRLYWDDWSKNIGDVTNDIAVAIRHQVDEDEKINRAFNKFLTNFKKLINPSIDEQEAINMLAEHIVTLPVLKAIFRENDLIDQNPVTKIMEGMVKKLHGAGEETERLDDFYESVRQTVEGIDSSEGRQELIRTLFEKFFKYALPKSSEKFGIVYTPIEVVDFIINSVSDVLEQEFHEKITDPGIKILDPFTGTGTFIVRLIDKLKESGISDEDLKKKYQEDIWCNEIMLLSYYIALINIEDTYARDSGGEYLPFEHAVMTDTFQLGEKRRNKNYPLFGDEEAEFRQANAKAEEEDKTDIRIIIGNPPYFALSKNANDNVKKENYQSLDDQIRSTYLKDVNKNVSSVFDSYVRAFRWASDRIGDDGIISFVSNGSYIDNLSFSGFRRQLLKEFNHIYVYNLRGACRRGKQEGGNVFGNSSTTLICIIVLVKHKGEPSDGFIHYKDIGDNLSTKDKLERISDVKSVSHIEWEKIYPDKDNDWINKQNPNYKKFLLSGNKKSDEKAVFSSFYSRGIATGKDVWQYNFSLDELRKNNIKYLNTYNSEVSHWVEFKKQNNNKPSIAFNDFVDKDPQSIKWSNALYIKGNAGKIIPDNNDYRDFMYRPFVKKHMAFNPPLFYDFVKWGNLLPDDRLENYIISLPGIGEHGEFSAIVSNRIIDLCCNGAHDQCFPLYWYTKCDESPQLSIFEETTKTKHFGYTRTFAIGPEIVTLFRKRYQDPSIDEKEIFAYTYGVFHEKEYISRYKNNLMKELPRIPFLKDFKKISEIGKKLIDLHINYEHIAPYDGVQIHKKVDNYTVKKIRFASRDDWTTIIFNDSISIFHIPLETYNYRIHGRSPIEWVLDQYQYTVDEESGIIDDPNRYDEVKGGKYVFDLILSLITVSLETQRLIAELPPYEEIE